MSDPGSCPHNRSDLFTMLTSGRRSARVAMHAALGHEELVGHLGSGHAARCRARVPVPPQTRCRRPRRHGSRDDHRSPSELRTIERIADRTHDSSDILRNRVAPDAFVLTLTAERCHGPRPPNSDQRQLVTTTSTRSQLVQPLSSRSCAGPVSVGCAALRGLGRATPAGRAPARTTHPVRTSPGHVWWPRTTS